jgi:hypothetical protein
MRLAIAGREAARIPGRQVGTALVGHAHRYAGRGHALKRPARIFRAPRLVAPHDLSLFSDRLDDARERESTVRDFALLHEQALSVDNYNN